MVFDTKILALTLCVLFPFLTTTTKQLFLLGTYFIVPSAMSNNLLSVWFSHVIHVMLKKSMAIRIIHAHIIGIIYTEKTQIIRITNIQSNDQCSIKLFSAETSQPDTNIVTIS